MIVCSCNVLSDNDVRACLNPGPGCPRTPAQVYQCLGCSPDCGRCARTLRAMMDVGARHFYISNLPLHGATATLGAILNQISGQPAAGSRP